MKKPIYHRALFCLALYTFIFSSLSTIAQYTLAFPIIPEGIQWECNTQNLVEWADITKYDSAVGSSKSSLNDILLRQTHPEMGPPMEPRFSLDLGQEGERVTLRFMTEKGIYIKVDLRNKSNQPDLYTSSLDVLSKDVTIQFAPLHDIIANRRKYRYLKVFLCIHRETHIQEKELSLSAIEPNKPDSFVDKSLLQYLPDQLQAANQTLPFLLVLDEYNILWHLSTSNPTPKAVTASQSYTMQVAPVTAVTETEDQWEQLKKEFDIEDELYNLFRSTAYYFEAHHRVSERNPVYTADDLALLWTRGQFEELDKIKGYGRQGKQILAVLQSLYASLMHSLPSQTSKQSEVEDRHQQYTKLVIDELSKMNIQPGLMLATENLNHWWGGYTDTYNWLDPDDEEKIEKLNPWISFLTNERKTRPPQIPQKKEREKELNTVVNFLLLRIGHATNDYNECTKMMLGKCIQELVDKSRDRLHQNWRQALNKTLEPVPDNLKTAPTSKRKHKTKAQKKALKSNASNQNNTPPPQRRTFRTKAEAKEYFNLSRAHSHGQNKEVPKNKQPKLEKDI